MRFRAFVALAILLAVPAAGCLDAPAAPPGGAPPTGGPSNQGVPTSTATVGPPSPSPLAVVTPTPTGGAPAAPPTPATPTTTPPTPATPTAVPTEPPQESTPSFRTLVISQSSGYAEEGRLVLGSEREWSAFWERHAAAFTPSPPRPEVDFTRERVLVAALGLKPSTCWHVRVAAVSEDAGGLRAHVTTYVPPPDAVCGSGGTQPLHVVAIPRTPAAVAYAESQREGPPPSGE